MDQQFIACTQTLLGYLQSSDIPFILSLLLEWILGGI